MSDYPLGSEGMAVLRGEDVEWLRHVRALVDLVIEEKQAERGGQTRSDLIDRILEADPSDEFVLLVNGGGGVCALATEGGRHVDRAIVTWANLLLYGETAPLEIVDGKVRVKRAT